MPPPQNNPSTPPTMTPQLASSIAQYVPEARIPQQAPTQPPAAQNQPVQPAAPVLSPIQPSNAVNAPAATMDGSQLDPSVVKVMKAIASVETGGTYNYNAIGDNGDSMGAFQWNNGSKPVATGQTPINWQNAAQQYLGDASAPMTPANQNYVAYHQIADYKAKGLTPDSIDALWNGAHPDPNNPGQYLHISPQRATQFTTALQQQMDGTAPPPIQPQAATSAAPSISGFLGNALGSGASFLGNVGSALLHPIQTVQNLASVPVGALQEAGGETTPETAQFDAVKNAYASRYGSIRDIANTIYKDPVGFLADLSVVAGGAGAAIGGAAKLADLGEIGNVARAATADAAAVPGTGVAGATDSVAQTLDKVSRLSNPLAPVISGAGALLSKGAPLARELGAQVLGLSGSDIENIMEHPESFTPEQIGTVSRVGLAQEVEGAFDQRINALSETGTGYNAIKEDTAPISVAPTFLDDQMRENAGVNVKDGQISATPDSEVRDPKDIRALQNVYNFWKPTFQNGEMTPQQLLHFREDVNTNMAKFERETTASPALKAVGKKLYAAVNKEYRPQVKSLEELDSSYSSQRQELDTLRKGIIDKEGNLMPSAINKIANAAKKGNDATLAKLEKVLPGITQRIRILKTIENIQDLGENKVGTGMKSLVQEGRLGGMIYGAATGNIKVLAGALAADFIARPDISVPLLRALAKTQPEVLNATLASLSRYVVLGASSLNSATTPPSGTQSDQSSQPVQTSDQGTLTDLPPGTAQSSMQGTAPQQANTSQDTTISPALTQLAESKNFDIKAALAAGYTVPEITDFLSAPAS